MNVQTSQPDLTLEQIEEALQKALAEFIYFYRKTLLGRVLIIKLTNTIGLGIKVKKGRISIEDHFPSLAVLFLLGSGAALIYLFNRSKRQAFRDRVNSYFLEKYSSA